MAPGETERDRLRAAAERVARSYALDVFDMQFRREPRGWVLRVILDRPYSPDAPAGGPEESIGLDDCQKVSEDLSAILDVEDGALGLSLPDNYILEVSSPGLDRPLRGAEDYRRFAGRLAKIVSREPVHGQSAFSGRIQGLEDGEVVLVEGRRTHRIPLASIARAHLDVEF